MITGIAFAQARFCPAAPLRQDAQRLAFLIEGQIAGRINMRRPVTHIRRYLSKIAQYSTLISTARPSAVLPGTAAHKINLIAQLRSTV